MRVAFVAAVLAGLAVSISAAERDAALSERQPLDVSGAAAPRGDGGGPAGLGSESSPLRVRWAGAPQLVVLTSVMNYRMGSAVAYEATGDVLGSDEADELVADLTGALRVLTNDTVTRFAGVRLERPAPGAMARIVRPGVVVVGRYRGIRELRRTIGFGGRVPGPGQSISSAAVLLDSDFDRTSPQRQLLRAHELGHALGYDHIDSRPSIMNSQIGSDLTDLDRELARRAFPGASQDLPLNQSANQLTSVFFRR